MENGTSVLLMLVIRITVTGTMKHSLSMVIKIVIISWEYNLRILTTCKAGRILLA